MSESQNLEETIKHLRTSGVLFCVEYVGSVVVEKSINTLPADKQTEAARSCMRLVIQNAGLQEQASLIEDESGSNKFVCEPVQPYGRDVELNISSSALILIDPSTMRPLHRFKIQDVSLLSPGFDEFSCYFCFFAKTPVNEQPPQQWLRKCFVFNAHEEMEDIRDIIYFAFRLNEHINGNGNAALKQFASSDFQNGKIHDGALQNTNRRSSNEMTLTFSSPIDGTSSECRARDGSRTPVPCSTPPTPVLNEESNFSTNFPQLSAQEVKASAERQGQQIFLAPRAPSRSRRSSACSSQCSSTKMPTTNSSNCQRQSRCCAALSTPAKTTKCLAGSGEGGNRSSSIPSGNEINFPIDIDRYGELVRDLGKQQWFHGVLSRDEAQALVRADGQFLVRASPKKPNQIVLVGMHDEHLRHVCLIARDGKIQTTIGEFRNIVDLVKYFHQSRTPMMLDGEQLRLLFPINRKNELQNK